MTIKDLKPQLIWEIFDQITKVPRPSKKEDKIREFVVNFAKEHNVEYKVDEIGNVALFKPATKGYENAPTVVLQGHMDMVCEKAAGVEHDFEKDPITTVVDGEWVRTNGTTLGADNGIGMAAGMAVMIDDTLKHGPVQVLITVDEETGMTGANNLGEGMITGNILFNLDSEDEAQLFIGCAGGIDTTCTFDYTPTATPAGYHFIKVDISKLLGGHSGSDINAGRACANKVIARFVWEESKKYPVELAAIDGGNLRNAIAHQAYVVIGVPAEHKEALRIDLNNYIATIEAEYAGLEKDMIITGETVDTPATCIDKTTATNLINALYCAPHGVVSMSRDIEGLVETSTNLASVKMIEGNKIVVTTSQRSSVESRKYDIAQQVEATFLLAGATVTHGDGYPAWTPNMDSKILKLASKAWEDLFNETPLVTAIHAGLECSLFRTNYKNLDMVSFGPTLRNVHSPKECMHIPAVDKFWKHLVYLLELVAKEY